MVLRSTVSIYVGENIYFVSVNYTPNEALKKKNKIKCTSYLTRKKDFEKIKEIRYTRFGAN